MGWEGSESGILALNVQLQSVGWGYEIGSEIKKVQDEGECVSCTEVDLAPTNF